MATNTQQNVAVVPQELLGIKIIYRHGNFTIEEVKNIKGYLPSDNGDAKGHSFNIISNKGEIIYSITKEFPKKVFVDDLVRGTGNLEVPELSIDYILMPGPVYAKDLIINDESGKLAAKIDISQYIKGASTQGQTTVKPKGAVAKSLPYVGIGALIVILAVVTFIIIRRRRLRKGY